MIPVIPWNIKVIIWIVVGIAGAAATILSFVLQSNLAYFVRRLFSSSRRLGGRKPASKPKIIWFLYIFSILIVVFGTAVASSWNEEVPIPAPPAAEKLYYMTVVDASDRMLSNIGASEQKWQVAVRSLKEKLSILPSGANFGLVAFGQASPSNTLPCSAVDVLVPVSDASAAEELQGESSQQRALLAVAGITPGNKGSLTEALRLAVEQLVSNLPADYSKTIIVVTGGGDACKSQDEWSSLEFLLSGNIKDLNVYTELIVLVDEEVEEEIAAKVQHISRLEGVTVSLPTTVDELNATLEDAVDRAIERGMAVDPAPFVIQETIVAATRVSQSVSFNMLDSSVPAATQPVQVVLTFTQPSPDNKIASFPTTTPLIILTATPTRGPTSMPAIPPPTQIPPTEIPPTAIPPTDIPPTSTPEPIAWAIISPNGRYGVLLVYGSGAHYRIFDIQTNSPIFTTSAQFPTDNDVKNGGFSDDGSMFAAVYHYSDPKEYSWIGVWNMAGNFLYSKEVDGFTLDLSGAFNGP